MCIVVNCKCDYDVYIGRPSTWGNPFKIGIDGNRDEVIKKYEIYLLSNKKLLKKLSNLVGLRLGCFCKPKKCHGDVIAELVSKIYIKKTYQLMKCKYCDYHFLINNKDLELKFEIICCNCKKINTFK